MSWSMKSKICKISLKVSFHQINYLDTSEKDLVRELKRESAEYRRKYQESFSQISELKTERDDLKSQKTEVGFKEQKSMDDEKATIKNLQAEIERLKFKIKCSEEELQKEVSHIDEKQREIHSLKLDKSSQESVVKEKERMIMTLNRQLNDSKDDVKNKEREFKVTLQKLTDDEKQRSNNDRLEIENLKDKIQNLEQKLYRVELREKKEIQKLEEFNDKYEKEARLSSDENKTLKNKTGDLYSEIDIYKKTNIESTYIVLCFRRKSHQ